MLRPPRAQAERELEGLREELEDVTLEIATEGSRGKERELVAVAARVRSMVEQANDGTRNQWCSVVFSGNQW